MRVDVSEIKSFKNCKRNWEYTSRNRFHLQPFAPNPNFFIGTLVHEALHALYIGGPQVMDKVLEMTLKEIPEDSKSERSMLTNIITKYTDQYLIPDLEQYEVLDIEYGFSFELPACPDVEFCGSIDMIVRGKEDGLIYGFEHKTAKAFRNTFQLKLDEQPRLYTKALQIWAEKKGYEVGGIFVNQVKKTIRELQVSRVLLTYTEPDLRGFLNSVCDTVNTMAEHVIMADSVDAEGAYQLPEPSYMGCLICDLKDICEEYAYENAPLKTILTEFSEEVHVREGDHLDEKSERIIEE